MYVKLEAEWFLVNIFKPKYFVRLVIVIFHLPKYLFDKRFIIYKAILVTKCQEWLVLVMSMTGCQDEISGSDVHIQSHENWSLNAYNIQALNRIRMDIHMQPNNKGTIL